MFLQAGRQLTETNLNITSSALDSTHQLPFINAGVLPCIIFVVCSSCFVAAGAEVTVTDVFSELSLLLLLFKTM